MNEKVLTISIAAYNVEKYIRKALDSIVIDEIIDDIEIYVVDDGGNDNTLEIARQYADRYPNSIFPVHKENGGYGSTINYTLKHARGKYFKQLDGDDWFESDFFVAVVKLLKTIDDDIVISAVGEHYESDGRTNIKDKHKYLSSGSYNVDAVEFKDFLTMHMSFIKTSILQEHSIRITEHCFYSDVELVAYPLPYFKTIYVIHDPIYVYRIGREGQSMSKKSIVKHYKDHEKVLFELIGVYKAIGQNEKSKRDIMRFRIRKEIAEHFRFMCYLPVSKNTSDEMKMLYRRLINEVEELVLEAKKYSLLFRALADSRFILYPILSVYAKAKR